MCIAKVYFWLLIQFQIVLCGVHSIDYTQSGFKDFMISSKEQIRLIRVINPLGIPLKVLDGLKNLGGYQ